MKLVHLALAACRATPAEVRAYLPENPEVPAEAIEVLQQRQPKPPRPATSNR